MNKLEMQNMSYDTEGNSLGQYLKWLEKGTLVTGIDFQRNFVWPVWKRTNLFLSIVIGLPIPAINVYRPIKGDKIKKVYDGRQRLTSFQQIAENQFQFDTSKFPFQTFTISGTDYNREDFHGKTLSELPEEIQEIFMDRNLKMEIISGAGDELAEVFFSLMNMGAEALKPQEVRLATMGKKVRDFFNSQKECSLFNHSMLSDKQKTNNIQHDILGQISLLLSLGVSDLSAANVDGFINQYRNTGLPEELQNRITAVISYLSEVTDILVQKKIESSTSRTKGRKSDPNKPVRINYLTKLNIVSLAGIADKAITAEVSEEKFAEFASEFLTNQPKEYKEGTGSKTADISNVDKRINTITVNFMEWAGIEEEEIEQEEEKDITDNTEVSNEQAAAGIED